MSAFRFISMGQFAAPAAFALSLALGSATTLHGADQSRHRSTPPASAAAIEPLHCFQTSMFTGQSEAGGVAGIGCSGSLLSQSANPSIVEAENSLYCGTSTTSAESSLARSFGAMPQSTSIHCVTFGVNANVGAPWPVEVRILTGSISGTDNTTLLYADSIEVPSGMLNSLMTLEFPPIPINAGSELVVELRTPSRFATDGGDGGLLVLGCNDEGQTAPTYIRSPECGVEDFITTEAIGFPQAHCVMTLGMSAGEATTVSFDGLPHSSLGNATLSSDGDVLSVEGIGSTGNDGVRIDLGESQGVAIELGWPALPTAGSLSMIQLDPNEEEITTLDVSFGAEEYRYLPDFSGIGSETYSVTLIQNGEVVAELHGLSGDVISHQPASVSGGVIKKKRRGIDRCAKWGIVSDRDVDVAIAGYGQFAADAFEITADACPGPAIVSSTLVKGTDLPGIYIEREYLAAMDWTFFESVNGSQLDASAATVAVHADLDSAGPAVRMWALAGPIAGGEIPSDFSMTWDQTPALDVHGELTFSSTGRVGGVDGVVLGTLTIKRREPSIASGISIEPDYSAVGSRTQTAIVYKGDVAVGAVLHNASAINADCWQGGQIWYPEPVKCTKSLIVLEGIPTACYRKKWPQDLAFSFATGEVMVGDGIAILAEQPFGPVEGIESLTIEASHRDALTITSVDFTFPDVVPCPGDIDGNGAVDAADLAALLGAWGTADADLNGSGSTDAADLSILLGSWGGCS